MGQNPQLFVGGRKKTLDVAAPAARGQPRTGESRHARHAAWREACRGGPQSPGTFLTAGPISDTHNLGTVALRVRRKVQFDSQQMRITNVPAANKYLVREYRPGWEL